MKTLRKRIGTLMTAFLIGLGLLFVPGNSVYGMGASDFTDVSADYWGYSYIDFSANRGIINGYLSDDGTYQFRPENPVSKEESTAMLYRALNAAGKLKSNEDYTEEYTELFEEHKIAEWAQVYVAYGLKHGLITEAEISGFTDEAGLGIAAPREQVALWTAKAMERNLAPAYSLIYKDKDIISAENTAYVDLLYRHGIMQGDDKKLFNPTDGIKRAEFAAICNRVYESANSERFSVEKEAQSFRGTIVSVDLYSNKIMMTQSDGTSRMIQIEPKTQIVIDGRVNYNGLRGIKTSSTAIIAWGAFYDPNGLNPEDKVLQLHVTTNIKTMSGLLAGIERIDSETSILEIENRDEDRIYYVMDKESLSDGTLKKGKQVTFIADGIKILEIK
jgi:hypothetical protein